MKPHDLSNRFRQARMQRFLGLVAPLMAAKPIVRILDVGGGAGYWHALPGLYGDPKVEITVVNLGGDEHDDANLRIRHGNACELAFQDNSFDVVHSNSVIEHVGRWADMQAMAGEVRRLAPAYFVQTPNFWFPIEPHYRLPFVQFLPERLRAATIDVLGRNPTTRTAIGMVQQTRLLTPRQMRQLFPDATIEHERIAGLTKSVMAVRRPRSAST
jgi:2-polyprenyl-3-methyl-5-hydroxy-6-metoxy-1,4-benzoquinol methylase